MSDATVVFTDHTFDDLDLEREILAEIGADLIDAEASDEPLEALLADADGVIVMYEEVDGDLLDAMPNCRVVSRTGIGFDNVDLDAATERGVYVTNVPDYCIPEVSSHTIAHLLALERKIVEYNDRIKSGEWDVNAGRTMHRLDGQTLGLIAFGDIARAVAEKASAFGMDVLAHDPYVDEVTGDVRLVDDLSTLLAESDAVSIHSPLTPQTQGMIGADELAQMKESAFLVNTARGGIVDEDALAEAIREGGIAGAGLDVLAEEPPADDSPLLDLENVILTPHAAYNSAESVVELRTKAARNVAQTLAGDVPDYVVNDDVLD
ncbi:C-terminal binding protein [Haloplanus aerogenes]|uniref:C-terminal binding protein n=1 Tax=Haloplanus aerogenes TaxID=660522 RepID=A0A3M0D1L6_9EURY|nr:C-terminal binding protein [Haloplanus aerogenes]AZH23894.1 C-terminal binding protein [Haloplanus aerogenes]RMB13346.1 D-3-phosphoglycerate dehydrogenase [Haloplanus aerogenes]